MITDNFANSVGYNKSESASVTQTQPLKISSSLYENGISTSGSEWMAAHALQIIIFTQILTSTFDIYVKMRQLKRFDEKKIPDLYKEIKCCSND
jgi:hypothetical protein